MGKEKVENREKRGTIEPRSTIWRKDKAERGLGFSNIYLCLSSFRIGFFFFLNTVLMWTIMGVLEASVLYNN